MRHISRATFALASLLAIAPLTGAQASSGDTGYTPPPPPAALAPPEQVILGQLSSVMDGIAAGRSSGTLAPAEAGRLQADANDIRATTLASADRGQMSNDVYKDLLKRVGQLSEEVNPPSYTD